jgi:acetyltransferase-like isoleucine patch superfamily enzyme
MSIMLRLRLLASALVILCLPSAMCRPILRMLGHGISRQARFGFSLVLADKLILQGDSRIGHFNLLSLRRLVMRRGSYLGRSNVLHGPISVSLAECSAIGNNNKIVRGPRGLVVTGPATLRLGVLAKITAEHRLDCTASVSLGSYTTMAGTSCELWTHGYVHDQTGPGRYRIDGPVRIGNNVYIGSASIITAGVTIADGVIIGAGTTVARSLVEPGLYVSAGLRQLKRPDDPLHRVDLMQVNDEHLCERVFIKRSGD